MARIRTIKPEFPQSESIGRLSRDARLLFLQMWTLADDSGRLRGSSRILASLLYPFDDDAFGLAEGWVTELLSEKCICRYEVDNNTYIEICNWLKHQKIDKPTASRLPPPRESSRILANPTRDVETDLVSRTSSKTTIEEENYDPSMVATFVLNELSLSGQELLRNLTDICKARIAKGGEASCLRRTMVDSWKRYKSLGANGTLEGRYTKKPAGFFGDGDWENESSWPWVNGKAPERAIKFLGESRA